MGSVGVRSGGGSESEPHQVSSSESKDGGIHQIDIPNHRIRKESMNSIGSSLARGTTLLCFRMSDVVVSLLILLPLNIALWRGIWQIMDFYTQPWVSILIGNVIPLTLYYFQEELKEVIHPHKMAFPLFYFISRLLLLTHAFASINQWRGIWELLDQETGMDSHMSAIITLLAGSVGLMLFKVFCNVLAIPLFVGVDEATSVHDCPLRYKTGPDEPKWKYFLDCFWSAIVVQNLVVLAWRGLWNLASIYLYPQDPMLSAIVSIGIGTGIVVVLSILQPCYFRFMIKLKGWIRLSVFDIVTTWGFIACILTWRGTWELYNILIVFDVPLASEWLTVVVGAIGTLILGCLSTVSTRGITVDGEDSGDGTTEWPISYITLLQKKRHHGIPFPEPWLFRYLCTSQRMRMTEPLTLRRKSTVAHTDDHVIPESQRSNMVEDIIPIKLIKNSIYVDHFDPLSKVESPPEEDVGGLCRKKENNSNKSS